MAQAQKTAKQSKDRYTQRGKTLTSAVQRLRGWVGSDPSREPELADALVELTAHRLLGHGYAASAADAQEAVRRAADLLTAGGPIGPYTSPEDAVRYVTAVVHLAAVQVGLGLPESAGRTLAALDDTVSELGDLELDRKLDPVTSIWSLSARARAALASGDVAAAEGLAETVLTWAAESGLLADPDAEFVAIDADRLASDTRWAAGRDAEALEFLHSARDRYDVVADGRLREPARLSQALAERLSEPLFGLYRDLADRLAATGEIDLALVTRRTLVDLLRGLTGALGEVAGRQLAAALADLADDLLHADRIEEADTSSAEAAVLVLGRVGADPVQLRVAAVRANVLSRTDRPAEAIELLSRVLPDPPTSATTAGQAAALLALAEAWRAAGREDAGELEAAFEAVAEDLAGPVADARLRIFDLARGVLSRGESSSVPTPRSGPTPTSAWLAAERAEAHRLEVERQELARLEHERREADRRTAEEQQEREDAAARAAAAAAERLEAEQRAAAEEAERAEVKRRREERLEEHRREVEAREAAEAELAGAEEVWRRAKADGDRRATRAALERVVELLRPLAEDDLEDYGPRLRSALEELSGARLRSGDVWGSRAPAKEAKALAKALGQ